jgi:hypothetical protein
VQAILPTLHRSLDDDLADHAMVGVGFAVPADDPAAQIGGAAGRAQLCCACQLLTSNKRAV